MMAIKKLNKKAKVGIVCSIVFAFILLSSFIIIKAGDSGSTETSKVIGDKEKIYDNSTETITIKKDDTKEELVKIQLDTPRENQVGLGYQLVAEKTAYPETDIDSFIKGFVVKDLNEKGQVVSKQIDVKYKSWYDEEVIDWEEVCEEEFDEKNGTIVNNCILKENGTHFEKRYTWETFNNNLITKENITIGLFTDVKQGDYYEWVPTYTIDKTDISVEEWATWSGNLSTGLVSAWKLDEPSGTTAIDYMNLRNGSAVGEVAVNQPAILGTGWNATSSGDGINVADNANMEVSEGTINLWVKPTWNPSYTSRLVAKGGTTDDVNHPFVFQANDGATQSLDWDIREGAGGTLRRMRMANVQTSIPSNQWTMVTLVWNSSGMFYFSNAILINSTSDYGGTGFNNTPKDWQFSGWGGTNRHVIGTFAEITFYNRSLSQIEINYTFNSGNGCSVGNENCYLVGSPTITLNSPINNYNTSSNNIIFNCTGTDNNEVENITLYINDLINGTNSSVFNNTPTIFQRELQEGDYSWKCGACDNESQCTNSSARTLTIDQTTKPYFNVYMNVSSVEVYVDNSTWISVDPDIIKVNNTLYVVYSDATPTPGHMYLKNSTDGGVTWSLAYNLSQAGDRVSANPFINHLSNGKWVLSYMNQTSAHENRNTFVRVADTWQELATATATPIISECNGVEYQCEANTNILELPNGELLYILRVNDTANGVYTQNIAKIKIINASIDDPDNWSHKSWITETPYYNTAHWYLANLENSSNKLITAFYNNTPEHSEDHKIMFSDDGGLNWYGVYNYNNQSDVGRPALYNTLNGLLLMFYSERTTDTHYLAVSSENGQQGTWQNISVKDYASEVGYGTLVEISPKYFFLAYSTPNADPNYNINGTWVSVDETQFNLGEGQSLSIPINVTFPTYELDEYSINWTSSFEINSSGYLKNISEIQSGISVINVTANNSLGNVASKLFYVFYPFPPDDSPNITLISPTEYYNSSIQEIEFICKATDDNQVENITFYLNDVVNGTNVSVYNNTNTSFIRTLADGVYSWNCGACDNATNPSPQCANGTARTFTMDTSQPQFTETNLNVSTIYNVGDPIRLNTTITDTNLDTCWYEYAGSNTTFVCATGVLNEEDITTIASETDIRVWANDSLGNTNSSALLTFAYETTPPSVSILYPVNAFVYTGANAPTQFNYSATDPAIAFCWYSINQGLTNSTPYSTCPNITEMSTSYGNNTWRIYANDTSGNFNYSEVSFTLAEPVIGYGQYGGSASYDLTMPTASIISNETINNEEKNPENFAQLIDKWSKNRNFVIFVVLLTLMFLASYGKSRRRK